MGDAAPLSVGGHDVAPGHRERVELPVARLVTGGWARLRVEAVHGARPGPRLWLSGAVHGDELDGIEIVRRVAASLDPATLAGAVLAVPVVNVFGFIAESRYLPDRRDLNRCFPGSTRGSLGARLAHLFLDGVAGACSHGIDFHCGSDDRVNLPHVRADLGRPEARALAHAFGAPVAVHAPARSGSLREAATRRGRTVVVFEGGEAGRFTPSAIDAGVAGTLRAMRSLGMLEATPDAGEAPPVRESRHTRWTRAGRSGVLRLETRLGAEVRAGQRLGTVADAFGGEPVDVRARADGVVLGLRRHPLVHQGEAVVHVAEYDRADHGPDRRSGDLDDRP